MPQKLSQKTITVVNTQGDKSCYESPSTAVRRLQRENSSMTGGTGLPFGSRHNYNVKKHHLPFITDASSAGKVDALGKSPYFTIFFLLFLRKNLQSCPASFSPGLFLPSPSVMFGAAAVAMATLQNKLVARLDHLYPTWATWRLLASFSCLSSTKRQTSWLRHGCLSNARALQPQGVL